MRILSTLAKITRNLFAFFGFVAALFFMPRMVTLYRQGKLRDFLINTSKAALKQWRRLFSSPYHDNVDEMQFKQVLLPSSSGNNTKDATLTFAFSPGLLSPLGSERSASLSDSPASERFNAVLLAPSTPDSRQIHNATFASPALTIGDDDLHTPLRSAPSLFSGTPTANRNPHNTPLVGRAQLPPDVTSEDIKKHSDRKTANDVTLATTNNGRANPIKFDTTEIKRLLAELNAKLKELHTECPPPRTLPQLQKSEKDALSQQLLATLAEGEIDPITVIKLLQRGADANIQAQDGAYPLHKIAVLSDPSLSLLLARILVQYNADVNKQNEEGETALHISVAFGKQQKMLTIFLLAAHTRLGIVDQNKHTPLHIALALASIGVEYQEIASILIHNNAPLQDANNAFEPPLWQAIQHECTLMQAYEMLEKGAKVNIRGIDNYTPLHETANNGHIKATLMLYAFDGDLSAVESNGYTPIALVENKGKSSLWYILKLIEHITANYPAVIPAVKARLKMIVATPEWRNNPLFTEEAAPERMASKEISFSEVRSPQSTTYDWEGRDQRTEAAQTRLEQEIYACLIFLCHDLPDLHSFIDRLYPPVHEMSAITLSGSPLRPTSPIAGNTLLFSAPRPGKRPAPRPFAAPYSCPRPQLKRVTVTPRAKQYLPKFTPLEPVAEASITPSRPIFE